MENKTIIEAFDGVATMLAQLDPEKVLTLHATKEMSARVAFLVNKKKDEQISWDETLELERFLALDLLISLAKARAISILK